MKRVIGLLFITTALLILGTASTFAQDYKVEISGHFGYTFSEGVDLQPTDIGGGRQINRINPTSGMSWGAQFDFLASEHWAIGFAWSQQDSNLEARVIGEGKENFVKMDVHNFHGVFTYNMGDYDDAFRPYIFGGLGATSYRPGSIGNNQLTSHTRFSTTWGGGVKYFFSDHLALKMGVKWTPTYIKSSPGGIWCDPWAPWLCWYVSNSEYSHQFEFSGGIVIRF